MGSEKSQQKQGDIDMDGVVDIKEVKLDGHVCHEIEANHEGLNDREDVMDLKTKFTAKYLQPGSPMWALWKGHTASSL